MGDFLDSYNALIEELILASSLGLSPHIPQAPTPLEKHYVQEMSDSEHEGVEELNSLQGENNNFINRTLSLLHRLWFVWHQIQYFFFYSCKILSLINLIDWSWVSL